MFTAEERLELVLGYRREGGRVEDFAAPRGVSAASLRKWLVAFDTGGTAALERSRTVATPVADREAVTVRKGWRSRGLGPVSGGRRRPLGQSLRRALGQPLRQSLGQPLGQSLRRALGRPEGTPGAHDEVVDAERLDDVVLVDQSELGRTPRANAATYVGAWDGIRALFARAEQAKARGGTASAFSFNVEGGRCERCRGDGHEKVEMQFLSDVYVPCPDCDGRRFRPEVCELAWEGLTRPEALRLTVEEALERFRAHPRVLGALRPLADVGLGYLRLGQPLSTLSGGEAQRLRIAEALAEGGGRRPRLYVLDEPTTGLHLEDVAVLLRAVERPLPGRKGNGKTQEGGQNTYAKGSDHSCFVLCAEDDLAR